MIFLLEMENSNMNLIKTTLLIIFLWPVLIPAQNPPDRQREFQDSIFHAFINGEIQSWERTLTEMERWYRQNPGPSMLYDLLLARYGYIAMALAEQNNQEARTHLDKAETELQELFKYTPYQSQAHALQGAFLGFRISLRPITAVRLGPRSYRAIDTALELNPNNPTAWMEKGNSRFYTPSTFGGSKQEAMESYRKAVALFEKNLTPNHRWLYLNSLLGLARSYQYLDQHWMAVATLESALRFEPGFKWVRDELLPEARKKVK
jgi:tetratricopeptide (TPR) repeat protein